MKILMTIGLLVFSLNIYSSKAEAQLQTILKKTLAACNDILAGGQRFEPDYRLLDLDEKGNIDDWVKGAASRYLSHYLATKKVQPQKVVLARQDMHTLELGGKAWAEFHYVHFQLLGERREVVVKVTVEHMSFKDGNFVENKEPQLGAVRFATEDEID